MTIRARTRSADTVEQAADSLCIFIQTFLIEKEVFSYSTDFILQQKWNTQKSRHEDSRTVSHDSRQLLFLKVGLGKWMFTVLEALHIVKLNLELQKASYYTVFLLYKK